MVANYAFNLVEFRRRKAMVAFQSHRVQQELGSFSLTSHVNMNGFATVAREEKEPIRAALENRWTHGMILPAFSLLRYFAIRLTSSRLNRLLRYSNDRRSVVPGFMPVNGTGTRHWSFMDLSYFGNAITSLKTGIGRPA